MIRTNLSTRPFYNEGAVRLWLLLLAVAIAGATLFNVTRVLSYSRSDTELATRATQDERRAAELRSAAAKLRGSVDAAQIEAASAQAREANQLIDRRTFSWTELFNHFETTLPDDVRIRSVRPQIDKDRRITLGITVLARTVEDVNQFMENMEQTGVFSELLSRAEQVTDEGQLEANLEMVYTPSAPAPTER